MAEYNDPRGRVIVASRPSQYDDMLELARKVYPDSEGPYVFTLDDGTVLVGDILNEGDCEGVGLIDAAQTVVDECVPIPDKDSVYVAKVTLAALRTALVKLDALAKVEELREPT